MTSTPAGAPSGAPAGLQLLSTGRGRAVLTDDLLVALSWTGAKCFLVAQPLSAPGTEAWRIDSADGSALGCTPGAPALAGTTLVLPYSSDRPGRGIEAGRSERGVTGIGPDGRPRWRTPLDGTAVTPAQGGSDGLGGFSADLTLRDSRTGTVLHTELKTTGFPVCVSDGRTAVVCRATGGADPRQVLFAYDLTTRKRSWDIPAERVVAAKIVPRSMVDGRVFFSTVTGGALAGGADEYALYRVAG